MIVAGSLSSDQPTIPHSLGVAFALGLHGLAVVALAVAPAFRVTPPAPPINVETIDLAAYEALIERPQPEPPHPLAKAAPIIKEAPPAPLPPDPEPVLEPEPEPVVEPEPEPIVLEKPPAPEPSKPKRIAKPRPEPKPIPVARTTPSPTPAPPPAKTPTVDMAATSSAVPIYTPPNGRVAHLNNPKPPYPRAARRRGMAGVVMLRVNVSAQGRPLSVHIQRSSGFPVLDRSACQTVWKWRFVPASKGGVSVAATIDVPVRFRLQNG